MTHAQFLWCIFGTIWAVCSLGGLALLIYAIKTAPPDPQEAPMPTQGAHGAYEEPERTRELREAFVAREEKRQAKVKRAVTKLIRDSGGC